MPCPKKTRVKTPSIKQPRWHLVDADPIAAKHKETFEKPTRQEISRVRPGDHVMLIFRFGPPGCESRPGERMWVLVDERLRAEGFRGRLRNDPFIVDTVKFDDPVEFKACHVISIDTSDRPAEVEAKPSLV